MIVNGLNLNEFFDSTGRVTAAQHAAEGRIIEARINGHDNLRLTLDIACPRCGGTGVYFNYGTCFRCGGTRRAEETATFYTRGQLERAEANRLKNAEKFRAEQARKDARLLEFLDADPDLFWMLYLRVDDERREGLLRADADRYAEQEGLSDYDYIAKHAGRDYNDIKGRGFEEWRATSSFAAGILHSVTTGKPLTDKQREACERMKRSAAERRAEHERKLSLGHLGAPGDVLELEVELERIVSVDGRFGTVWIVGMRAASGHALVYKGATIWWHELPVDDAGHYVIKGTRLRVKARIKEHTEYRGVPQTRLERVKQLEASAA